VLPKVVCHYRL